MTARTKVALAMWRQWAGPWRRQRGHAFEALDGHLAQLERKNPAALETACEWARLSPRGIAAAAAEIRAHLGIAPDEVPDVRAVVERLLEGPVLVARPELAPGLWRVGELWAVYTDPDDDEHARLASIAAAIGRWAALTWRLGGMPPRCTLPEPVAGPEALELRHAQEVEALAFEGAGRSVQECVGDVHHGGWGFDAADAFTVAFLLPPAAAERAYRDVMGEASQIPDRLGLPEWVVLAALLRAGIAPPAGDELILELRNTNMGTLRTEAVE